MRHATREGNKPSFWTYLKVNGCRGCLKQEEEETIHHVISGGCEGVGKKENNKYREELRAVLQKCKKLMCDKRSSAGVIQADKAIRALEQPRRQVNQSVREDEEQALRQMISGIIPEWQEVNDKDKRGSIETMKLWTGDLMNSARIQMKTWMEKKNEHKARVQRRWDNRGIMKEAFQTWKTFTGRAYMETVEGKENEKDKGATERTYGIKRWGKIRTTPRLHKQVKKFFQMGIG
eukprot:5398335-Pleurochrysis_carterae.AAC.1